MKKTLGFFAAFVLTAIVALTILFLVVSAPPEQPLTQTGMVNDVTGMNPILVSSVHRPESIAAIASLVKNF